MGRPFYMPGPVATVPVAEPQVFEATCPETDAADAARLLHSRRALEQALDHGTALLAALGLPPLRSMTRAMAMLDALDAPGEDLEPWLTGFHSDRFFPLDGECDDDAEESDFGEDDGTAEPSLGALERHPSCYGWGSVDRYPSQEAWGRSGSSDREQEITDEPHDDEGEAEWSLGWAANVSQIALGNCQDDGDLTALETHGKGFRRSGHDDAEDGHDAEWVNEDGDEDELRIPWLFDDGLDRVWLRAARVFGMQVDGDCCSPHILHGSSCHIDQEAKPEAGDFVTIFFDAVEDGRPIMKCWVKRLVYGIPTGMRWPHVVRPDDGCVPVLMVEQLNPPRTMELNVRRTHAVFKVVDIIPPAVAIAARARMAEHV